MAGLLLELPQPTPPAPTVEDLERAHPTRKRTRRDGPVPSRLAWDDTIPSAPSPLAAPPREAEPQGGVLFSVALCGDGVFVQARTPQAEAVIGVAFERVPRDIRLAILGQQRADLAPKKSKACSPKAHVVRVRGTHVATVSDVRVAQLVAAAVEIDPSLLQSCKPMHLRLSQWMRDRQEFQRWLGGARGASGASGAQKN